MVFLSSSSFSRLPFASVMLWMMTPITRLRITNPLMTMKLTKYITEVIGILEGSVQSSG